MDAEADRIRAEYARRAAEGDDRYGPTRPENVFSRQAIERGAIGALRRAGMLPLRGRRILDVGCGHGQWLADFESWGADRDRLAGIDLVPERAARSAARFPGADVREGDATALPWPDGSFDVVLQSMMFSSILDGDVRAAAAREMARVLRSGGVVLWYDFFVDNPRNKQVRGMRRRDIAALFGGFEADLRRVTLAPPLARAIVPRSRPLGALLEGLKLLDTHYVGTLRKR